MKSIFRLDSLLLYFLCFILFAVIGMTSANLSGASEGQGLAGGAIILFNGILFGIIAIGISAFATHKTQTRKVVRANKVLAIGVLALWAISILSLNQIKPNHQEKQIMSPNRLQKDL